MQLNKQKKKTQLLTKSPQFRKLTMYKQLLLKELMDLIFGKSILLVIIRKELMQALFLKLNKKRGEDSGSINYIKKWVTLDYGW